MNAFPVDSETVELRAVPAYVRNVNFGDHLSTIHSAEGSLVCTRIVRRSGQSTFRIWLQEPGADEWKQIAEEYARAGCLVDVISDRFLALSCPDELAPTISQRLSLAEKAGTFSFENGGA